MVNLGEQDLIGSGVARWCYAHPDELNTCIKIQRQSRRGRKQQRRELKCLRALQARGADLRMISAFKGVIATNLGKGYLYEMIRDEDGTPSRSLRYYFTNEPEMRSHLVGLLRELGAYLFTERVVFYDVHDGNIQCRLGAQGEVELIVVDGLGDRARLPFLNWFPAILERKIQRNWALSVANMNGRYTWLADFEAL